MKVIKLWQRDTSDAGLCSVAVFDNSTVLVADSSATTIINKDGTTLKGWWKEEPDGREWKAFKAAKVDPQEASRVMALWAWDIGHRFDTDPRRQDAINLLLAEIQNA
jgi:hypothetical protein